MELNQIFTYFNTNKSQLCIQFVQNISDNITIYTIKTQETCDQTLVKYIQEVVDTVITTNTTNQPLITKIDCDIDCCKQQGGTAKVHVLGRLRNKYTLRMEDNKRITMIKYKKSYMPLRVAKKLKST